MENQNTVGTQFKAMKILHAALCFGVIAILFVIRYLVKQDTSSAINDNKIFEIAGAVLGFVGVLGSRFMFFTKTRTAQSISSLAEKITIYRVAFIIQMALLEAAAIANAVLYYVTKNDLHFFMALGLLLFMIFGRPTRTMAGMLLFNPTEDKQQIYNDSLDL